MSALYPRETWEWFGQPGHFICGQDCRFHLCTKVGPWMVSTVGEYLPDAPVRESLCQTRGIVLEGRGDARRADYMRKVGWEEIGCDRTYETMVFRVDDQRCDAPDCLCGLPRPVKWGELDASGYKDARSATLGHYALCEKWSRLAVEPDPEEES